MREGVGEGVEERVGDRVGNGVEEQLGPNAHASVMDLTYWFQPLLFGQQIDVPPHSQATALHPEIP